MCCKNNKFIHESIYIKQSPFQRTGVVSEKADPASLAGPSVLSQLDSVRVSVMHLIGK